MIKKTCPPFPWAHTHSYTCMFMCQSTTFGESSLLLPYGLWGPNLGHQTLRWMNILSSWGTFDTRPSFNIWQPDVKEGELSPIAQFFHVFLWGTLCSFPYFGRLHFSFLCFMCLNVSGVSLSLRQNAQFCFAVLSGPCLISGWNPELEKSK